MILEMRINADPNALVCFTDDGGVFLQGVVENGSDAEHIYIGPGLVHEIISKARIGTRHKAAAAEREAEFARRREASEAYERGESQGENTVNRR